MYACTLMSRTCPPAADQGGGRLQRQRVLLPGVVVRLGWPRSPGTVGPRPLCRWHLLWEGEEGEGGVNCDRLVLTVPRTPPHTHTHTQARGAPRGSQTRLRADPGAPDRSNVPEVEKGPQLSFRCAYRNDDGATHTNTHTRATRTHAHTLLADGAKRARPGSSPWYTTKFRRARLTYLS